MVGGGGSVYGGCITGLWGYRNSQGGAFLEGFHFFSFGFFSFTFVQHCEGWGEEGEAAGAGASFGFEWMLCCCRLFFLACIALQKNGEDNTSMGSGGYE